MYILIKMVLVGLHKPSKKKSKIRNNSNFLVWFIVSYTKKNHYINKLWKDLYIFKLFINRKNDE